MSRPKSKPYSCGTNTRHQANLLGKLQLASRTQAALYAIRTGLSDPNLARLGE